jgi:WXG100 family type VII secretion target
LSIIGGELEQLRSLKANFERQSGAVHDLLTVLRSELDSVYWKGGAADRFRDAWQQQYEPMLTQLAGALVEAAQEVGRRTDALEAVGN